MRFDSLLVHYLARELDQRLAGAGARSVRLDANSLLAAVETEAGTLVLDLHPARGAVFLADTPPATTVLGLHRRSLVRRVTAPPDERLLVIELEGGPPARIQRVMVELMGNQWNALALDGGGRIVGVLRPRDAGGRRLRVGAHYQPPLTSARTGLEKPLERDEWNALLGAWPPGDREQNLVDHIAWTSPINAPWMLGPAAGSDDGAALETAHERYLSLARLPDPRPCLLEDAGGGPLQPYPIPLTGLPAAPAESLLEGIAWAAGAPPPGSASSTTILPELIERLRRRDRALARRIERLHAQALGAGQEALELRTRANVLLANLHAVRKGDATVNLPDFDGGTLEIELDPALTPGANATRMFEQARRREHAAARVPGIVAGVEAERRRLQELLERADSGEATAEELKAAAPTTGKASDIADAERLPYRAYRTSGGLEARVGRNRKGNDDLTFHHSSPNDIWLHARDAAGAHVVLRWTDPTGTPPHRDLTEAAILAALHSRSRTSRVVPVDWTRRKHVRKPRKAPPGLVVPERVKTIFVEPDPQIEKALRSRPG